MKYQVEITTFNPHRKEIKEYKDADLARNYIESIKHKKCVIFVAALNDKIDYGNFYIFSNEDEISHVMLHEHREFFVSDESFNYKKGITARFHDEDNSEFEIESKYLTSRKNALFALINWLPEQKKWEKLTWN